MFNAWRILKGKRTRGWSGAGARRKITPPRARWDPKVFRMKTFRDHPMYDKLKRITGMGTNINEILDYFDEVGVFKNSNWDRVSLEREFEDAQWTEADKFETLDYLLREHLNESLYKVTERTIGDEAGMNMQPREVTVTITDGTDSYNMIDDYVLYSKLVNEENPVSIADYPKDREQALYDYILPRIGNEANIESKFKSNFIGPNPEVTVQSFFSEEGGQLPDGIADAMIGLLKGGSHFGYMIMNKDGDYKRGTNRKTHLMERESPYPERPHPNELDVEGKKPRWKEFPAEEKDGGFWGWKQQLEHTGETGSDYDWTVASVVKQGKKSGAKEGKPKWYVNFVAIFHGTTPMFWAGIKVEWDSQSRNSTQNISSMLNERIKDWRRW